MELILAPDWTVEQVIEAYPQTIAVFIALKTDCAGCYLERFCTLEEVAASYDIALDRLLEALRTSIQFSAKGE